MKPVKELYNIHPDSDIYIIGSGTSMRVFPTNYLKDKITIGCNMAWKYVPVKYAVTIHPDLNVPEFMQGEKPMPEIIWVTKDGKSKLVLNEEQYKYAQEHFYAFTDKGQPNTSKGHDPRDNGRIPAWVEKPSGDNLYMWSSIAQTAMNLAANMGAKNIFLIGCDNCSLGGNHHGHKQHTRWKGVKPDYRYNQYYEGMAEVRDALVRRGVNVMSVTPFVGLSNYERDFIKQCNSLGKPVLITDRDVSIEKNSSASKYTGLIKNIFRK